MVKLRNWHKYAGLWSASIILLLAVTGFFLDHKTCSFLYTTTIPNSYLPDTLTSKSDGLTEAYWVDEERDIHLVGSKRGLFYKEGESDFIAILNEQILAIREESRSHTLFCATSKGIYRSGDARHWQRFALQEEYINALSLYDRKLVAVVDKRELVVLDAYTAEILKRTPVLIDAKELQHDITLSRFVRDFHYGRGLFDGIYSLLISDATAFLLTLLSISGLLIWFLVKRVRAKKHHYAKTLKPTIKIHANFVVILFLIPMILFSLTGIILDHSRFFNPYIKKVTLPHTILPPVYDSLSSDIWSVDYDGSYYRVGNRYGIYKSDDLHQWVFENRGLAYKMKRFDNTLLVSGMGSANRIYTPKDGWQVLPKTPHMFKDVWASEKGYRYFSSHHPIQTLPSFTDTTLYSLLLALHDGTFFASWWIYINDIAALLLLILLFSGTWRWLRRKRIIKPIQKRTT